MLCNSKNLQNKMLKPKNFRFSFFFFFRINHRNLIFCLLSAPMDEPATKFGRHCSNRKQLIGRTFQNANISNCPRKMSAFDNAYANTCAHAGGRYARNGRYGEIVIWPSTSSILGNYPLTWSSICNPSI